MTAVHQFVHSYVDHDATSTHARNLQRVIRSLGIESEIYAGEWRGEKCKATFFRDFSGGDWNLYHLATASPMASFLEQRPEQLAVNYHNITPYEFLAPWEPVVAPELDIARQQLRSLAPKTQQAMGMSSYSERELREVGYKSTSVAPILFDLNELSSERDEKVFEQLQRARNAGGSDWLFVGRVTPHKCQHQLIEAFAIYKRLYQPDARLHLVGGISSHRYWTVLNHFIERLELEDSVFLTKGVSDGALAAYYDIADIFICLSEHEGFGVPVLEAMHHQVPVIAFDAAAVGETLGTGGFLLKEKSPSLVAAAVHRITSDAPLRNSLIAAGEARLADFELSKSEAQWTSIIERLVSE